MAAGFLICAVLVLISCGLNNGQKFLKEKPDFLHTCQRKDADFNQCFANGLQNIFTAWKDGIVEVDNSFPIDPMFVEKFDLSENNGDLAKLTVHVKNVTVTGLSQAKVTNASINEQNYNFQMNYTVPRIHMDGIYMTKGRIMLLLLDTTGEMITDIFNSEFCISVKAKLRQQDNFKFFDLKSLKFHVNSIENVRISLDNLFKDKALNDNTNAIFNDNWRTFFEIMKSPIEQEISQMLLRHLQHVFDYVPANFFIADVENTAE